MDWITGIVGVLTTGAGGGIIGGIFGLFKVWQERQERIEMERLAIERDKIDAEQADRERAHQIVILREGAEIELDKLVTETEAEIDLQDAKSLASAQRYEFGRLNTSTTMDNLRASVRPVMAYWAMLMFNAMLCWAFYKWHGTVGEAIGHEILIGLFGTLSFTVSSVVSFYYVARRNVK